MNSMSGATTSSAVKEAKRVKKGRITGSFGMTVLAYSITLLIMFPFLWMILLSFKSNSEILNNPFSLPETLSFDNYERALATLNMGLLYTNTFIIAAITIVIEVLITFMSSYALTRMVFRSERLRQSVTAFLLAGLAIPAFILLFPVYRLTLSFGLLNTYASLIIPYIATSISFNTLLFTGFLRGFPREVEEAAIIDGTGLLTLGRSVVFPIIMPVVATVFIFNMLYIWNEFPFAVTLISNETMTTISLGISQFKGRFNIDYGGIIAASTLLIIPQLVFFAVFQRFIIEGMTAGAVKG
ncbi:raffinose/stachyose/melibiose transport system permease protein [Paenibacillus forsythiae]|uniref:Raffinose/stachyose/melibiose transport system permease protein n=1 Tax=Paenibacillus forsythiae TaxID=365616 RepID=A0ABU3HAT0_9BACL|nr:carbohydrate ABC transporter permease [Paenibacillus forsythiae]MDT3427919.1 raffinose/stachyose/melibiose transport system permease protein [Paenibacillus forsythiae]